MVPVILAPGTVVIQRCPDGTSSTYTIGALLGKGGFSICYELISTSSFKTYAAKVVAKASLTNAIAKTKLINEIRIHRNLNHERIVKFYHFFEDSDNVYIVLERCKHETLMELTKRRGTLSHPEVRFYLIQIVDVLEYLRGQKVIHRDLKLGNLFLHDCLEIKMGDFGLAAKINDDHERKTTICGTPNYIAPEILNSSLNGHSFEVDIWSLGVIMYTMLVGRPPFESSSIKETYLRIRSNQYEYPSQLAISSAAKDLVARMLVLNPSRRATLSSIRSHAFLTLSPAPALLPMSSLQSDPSHCFERMDTPMKAMTIEKENIAMKMKKTFGFCINQRSSSAGPVWNDCTTIIKTINYRDKYGIGYLTSAGAVGVYFNDATKIILDPSSIEFSYYERHSGIGRTFSYQSNGVYNDVVGLQKKVMLLHHFRKSIMNGVDVQFRSDPLHTLGIVAGVIHGDSPLLRSAVFIVIITFISSSIWLFMIIVDTIFVVIIITSNIIHRHTTLSYQRLVDVLEFCSDRCHLLAFVEKWSWSKHSMVFALSNGVIQVFFADRSQLVVNPDRVVKFTDKTKMSFVAHFGMGNLNCDDFRRRIEHARAMLLQMAIEI